MVAGSKGSAGAHGIKKTHLRILVIFEAQIWKQVGIVTGDCQTRMVAHGRYVSIPSPLESKKVLEGKRGEVFAMLARFL